MVSVAAGNRETEKNHFNSAFLFQAVPPGETLTMHKEGKKREPSYADVFLFFFLLLVWNGQGQSWESLQGWSWKNLQQNRHTHSSKYSPLYVTQPNKNPLVFNLLPAFFFFLSVKLLSLSLKDVFKFHLKTSSRSQELAQLPSLHPSTSCCWGHELNDSSTI